MSARLQPKAGMNRKAQEALEIQNLNNFLQSALNDVSRYANDLISRGFDVELSAIDYVSGKGFRFVGSKHGFAKFEVRVGNMPDEGRRAP